MKKFVQIACAGVATAALALSLSGCGNRQLFDTTYTFNEAILSMPDGSVVSGKVSSWRDYEDGDQIQVVIDGTTYLVHSSNIVLMNE